MVTDLCSVTGMGDVFARRVLCGEWGVCVDRGCFRFLESQLSIVAIVSFVSIVGEVFA